MTSVSSMRLSERTIDGVRQEAAIVVVVDDDAGTAVSGMSPGFFSGAGNAPTRVGSVNSNEPVNDYDVVFE